MYVYSLCILINTHHMNAKNEWINGFPKYTCAHVCMSAHITFITWVCRIAEFRANRSPSWVTLRGASLGANSGRVVKTLATDYMWYIRVEAGAPKSIFFLSLSDLRLFFFRLTGIILRIDVKKKRMDVLPDIKKRCDRHVGKYPFTFQFKFTWYLNKLHLVYKSRHTHSCQLY